MQNLQRRCAFVGQPGLIQQHHTPLARDEASSIGDTTVVIIIVGNCWLPGFPVDLFLGLGGLLVCFVVAALLVDGDVVDLLDFLVCRVARALVARGVDVRQRLVERASALVSLHVLHREREAERLAAPGRAHDHQRDLRVDAHHRAEQVLQERLCCRNALLVLCVPVQPQRNKAEDLEERVFTFTAAATAAIVPLPFVAGLVALLCVGVLWRQGASLLDVTVGELLAEGVGHAEVV